MATTIKPAAGQPNCNSTGYLTVKNHDFSNIVTIGGRSITFNFVDDIKFPDFNTFYEHLEKILTDVIDIIFKSTLNSTKAEYNNLVLMGGKATNNYIKRSVLDKSFDFDLHIADDYSNPVTLDKKGKIIADDLEKTITTSPIFAIFRKYLAKILISNDLISKDELDHYFNERLFYFGVRQKPSFGITGFFIHLKFKKDLFQGGVLYSNGVGSTTNEVYYPISDFEFERSVNFDIPISGRNMLAYTYKNLYEDINYANYYLTLHNLIRYLYKDKPYTTYSGTIGMGYKFGKNLNKLSKFIDIANYDCKFLSLYESNNKKLFTDFNSDVLSRITYGKLTASVRTVALNVTSLIPDMSLNFIETTSTGTTPYNILDYNIYNNLTNFDAFLKSNYKQALTDCSNSVVINYDYTKNYNDTIIKKGVIDYNSVFTSLESIITKLDSATKVIKAFTGMFYSIMTTYLQKKSFADPAADIVHNLGYDSKLMSEWDNIMEQIFIDYHADSNLNAIKSSSIADEFYLYRLQNITCFSGKEGNIFNLHQLKV